MAELPCDAELLYLQNSDSHAKYLCRYMTKLYKKNKCTDVVFRGGSSNSGSLSCHRLVLCAFSDYVTNVLKSVNSAAIVTLDLEDSAELDALRRTVDWVYKGKMTISSKEELAAIQNVARILEIGMLMQLFVDADSYKYPITVESPEHADILLSSCKRQYDEQSQEMLDTILVNKNCNFLRCHKHVLAAFSGVFNRMLRNLTSETAAKFLLTIDLNELKPRVDQEFLRLCLDFMYNGKVLVASQSDVSKIYEAAKALKIESLCEIAKNQINVERKKLHQKTSSRKRLKKLKHSKTKEGRNRKGHKSKESLLVGFSELVAEQNHLESCDVPEKVEEPAVSVPLLQDAVTNELYDVPSASEETGCDYANASIDESYQSSFFIEGVPDVSVEIIDVFKVNNTNADKDRNRNKSRNAMRNEVMVVRSTEKINRKPDLFDPERQDFRSLEKARQNLMPGHADLAPLSDSSSASLPVRVFGTKTVPADKKFAMEGDEFYDSSDSEEEGISAVFKQQNASVHKCPHCCDFVSSSADTLEAHVYLVHPKACRPFVCEDCTMRCLTSAGLAAHIRSSHMSAKAWICDLCRNSYYDRRNFERHRRVIHGIVKYQRRKQKPKPSFV